MTSASNESGSGGGPSLRSRILRGTALSTVSFGLARVLQLGSNLLLTRLLFPEAFGLMALVNVTIMGLTMLSDLGIAPGVVQSKRGDEPAFLDTAWTAQIVRGLGLWGIACAISVPLAGFYEQPELALLLPVTALISVLAGFESMAMIRFQRHLRMDRVVIIEIGSQLAGIAVMVTWALSAPSVWALVGGGLTGSAVRTLLTHAMSDRRDRLHWDGAAARELVHFGKWIFVSTLFAFLSTQLDRVIFGKTIPVSLLGIYSIAALFATMPGELLARLGMTVVFPAFSRKLEGAALGASYRNAKLPLLVMAALLVAPITATGSPLIATLYDPRYAEAGWMLQILAAGAWFRALEVPPGAALLALGAPRWVAAGHAAKVAGIAVLIPTGFMLGGFPGAVVGLSASQLLLYATAVVGARRHGLGGLRDDCAITMLLALAAGCGLLVVARLAALDVHSALQLAGGGLASIVALLAALYVLLRREGQSLRTLLRLVR